MLLPLCSTRERVSRSLDSRLPDIRQFHHTSCTKLSAGLTTSSPSFVDRCMRSILTRMAWFWRRSAGMYARTAHHSLPTTPPCQMYSAPAAYLPLWEPCCELLPITSGCYRHRAAWLTSNVAIGRPLQGSCGRFALNTLAHPRDPRFTTVTADRQGMTRS
jgi:hypothetical protein